MNITLLEDVSQIRVGLCCRTTTGSGCCGLPLLHEVFENGNGLSIVSVAL